MMVSRDVMATNSLRLLLTDVGGTSRRVRAAAIYFLGSSWFRAATPFGVVPSIGVLLY